MSIGLLRLFLDDFVYRFWIRPDDSVAWSAFGLGLLLLVIAFAPSRLFQRLLAVRRSFFLATLAATAALLSVFYVHHFLRGGPRIVDATSYYLQARGLASGHFAWPLDDPSASFRGRFLLAHDGHIGGIFPPGYPLVLAIGFLLGAPMLVGPALAAGHVFATYTLGSELVADAPLPERDAVGRVAALLSVFSVGLRYHTSDTMSHGATGLAVTLALVFALRGRREGSSRAFLFAGLFVGAAISMRMVSALSVTAIVGILLLLSKGRFRHALPLALGVLPGLLLLVIAQKSVTGSALESTQLAYYANSDGPPGCFRYGFGRGIGCVFEHGDFVEHRLKDGHTFAEALETTAFRLKFHLADALDVELLAVLLLPVLLLRSLFRIGTGLAVLLVILHIAAYLPFYFDGSYPGGGGRFYADVLAVELALVATTLLRMSRPAWSLRAGFVIAALMVLGFSTRSIREHRLLRDRDGGLPAFLPELAPKEGLLFVDSDAAFALAYQMEPSKLHVARFRGDAHDRVLYERLGKPPTFHYEFAEAPKVTPFVPKESNRFESEVDWPPLSQSGGYAIPFWPGCASDQRGLVAIPSGPLVRASLDLPVAHEGTFKVTPHVVDRAGRAKGHLALREPNGRVVAAWEWHDGDAEACKSLEPKVVSLGAGHHELVLEGEGGEVALDAVDLAREPRLPF